MTAAGILDLSIVTDALVDGITNAVQVSPLWTVNGGTTAKFNIAVTGMAFDIAREEGEVQLSLSLIHVGPNIAMRNMTRRGPDGISVLNSPSALTLTYALSSFAAKSYTHEQQAMSIALAWLLAHPYLRFTAGNPAHAVECTVTLTPANVDEISRLWQSLSGAMRLTSLFNVGVVFVGPDEPKGVPAPKPTQMGVLVGPTDPADAGTRLVAAASPSLISSGAALVALAPGKTAIVAGYGLNGPERLFLSPDDDSASIDVTAWASQRTANTLHLTLPAVAGVPPAGAPASGRYRLRIGTAPLTGTPISLTVGS